MYKREKKKSKLKSEMIIKLNYDLTNEVNIASRSILQNLQYCFMCC